MILHEMTMNNPFTQSDTEVQYLFDYINTHGEHVGDQDGLEIWATSDKNEAIYSIKQNNTITTIATFNTENNIWTLKLVHTLAAYRGKWHIHKLLWFIKSQEGKSILDYGVQTTDGIKFIKSLALSNRFEINWYNTKTGEKQVYNPTSDNINSKPYRDNNKITDWKILIEGDDNPSFERYDNWLVAGLYRVFE